MQIVVALPILFKLTENPRKRSKMQRNCLNVINVNIAIQANNFDVITAEKSQQFHPNEIKVYTQRDTIHRPSALSLACFASASKTNDNDPSKYYW